MRPIHPTPLQKSKPNPRRRPSKPASPIPRVARHHILVDCRDEATQRELFELLTQHGTTFRLLQL